MKQEESMVAAMATLSNVLESVQKPLKIISVIQRAKELYQDDAHRLSLVNEYRRLCAVHQEAIESYPNLNDIEKEQHGKHFESVVSPAFHAMRDFSIKYPLIAQLSDCLHVETH